MIYQIFYAYISTIVFEIYLFIRLIKILSRPPQWPSKRAKFWGMCSTRNSVFLHLCPAYSRLNENVMFRVFIFPSFSPFNSSYYFVFTRNHLHYIIHHRTHRHFESFYTNVMRKRYENIALNSCHIRMLWSKFTVAFLNTLFFTFNIKLLNDNLPPTRLLRYSKHQPPVDAQILIFHIYNSFWIFNLKIQLFVIF